MEVKTGLPQSYPGTFEGRETQTSVTLHNRAPNAGAGLPPRRTIVLFPQQSPTGVLSAEALFPLQSPTGVLSAASCVPTDKRNHLRSVPGRG